MEKNILKEVFGEAIQKSEKRYTKEFDQPPAHYKNRLYLFKLILFLSFVILIFQLIRLTVFQGSYYRQLSQNNRIREKIFPAPRGIIVDRKGEIIVRNKPGYLMKVKCGEKECYRKITHEEALKLEAKEKTEQIKLEVAREYTDDTAFSHVIGFTGSINPEEIDKIYCGRKLTYEDEVGRAGIEKAFDCLLKGREGKELYEIDALGNQIKLLSQIEAKAGEKLVLSLDKNLQLKAKEAMQNKTGAVIAHIPQTGEILVLYSSPSFDLNQFSQGLSETDYQKLLNDPNKPLFNRAISGVYPPGSTFKPIIAAAALEEKVIDQNTQIEDTGVINIGPFSFGNWYFSQYGKKEGFIDVVTALKRSNDIFFYKLGEFLTVEKIAFWAKKFNLGKTLGIEIDGEVNGLVPDPLWKEKTQKEKWFLGDTYHLAIGQGNLLTTPLQIAFALGSFANNGVICQPNLLKRDNCVKLTDKLYSENTLALVKEGMRKACQPGGTAYLFFNYQVQDSEIEVACKTGTAEFGDSQDRTHAWFFAFAPFNNPQIAVTVLVEAGGQGSDVAAPIAKEIFNEWFK